MASASPELLVRYYAPVYVQQRTDSQKLRYPYPPEVERWIEEAAGQTYGPPQKGKKFCVERAVKEEINWEVAGVVNEPRERPGRPVVFLTAGDHKVIGLGSPTTLRAPRKADRHDYETTSYGDLYAVPIDGSDEQAAFFDMEHGAKVRGADRKERFLFAWWSVDDAGHPRADDQIKMHFDQSTWGDPTIYGKFLRLPPGTL